MNRNTEKKKCKAKPIQGLLQAVRSDLERVRYATMLVQLHAQAHYHIH